MKKAPALLSTKPSSKPVCLRVSGGRRPLRGRGMRRTCGFRCYRREAHLPRLYCGEEERRGDGAAGVCHGCLMAGSGVGGVGESRSRSRGYDGERRGGECEVERQTAVERGRDEVERHDDNGQVEATACSRRLGLLRLWRDWDAGNRRVWRDIQAILGWQKAGNGVDGTDRALTPESAECRNTCATRLNAATRQFARQFFPRAC